MVELLTNPVVVTVLLTIAAVGFVIELFSPKIGLAGGIAALALVLFFYGHIEAGLAGIGTIILFTAGIILIFLELFLPGAVAGTLGAAALILSLFWAGENTLQMGISILIAIVAAMIMIFILIKMFDKKVVLINKMILSDSARKEDGYVSNINRTDLLGAEGIAHTVLRPAGMITINGERIDAVSEGDFIPQNAKIKVIEVEGARIVVREIK